MRNLILVLGDQLDEGSSAFSAFDARQDAVWICEAPAEATYTWSHKARIAIFLAAMRHFRDALRARDWHVDYHATGAHPHASLADALAATLAHSKPVRVVVVEPGEWRLVGDFERVCSAAGVPLVVREDRHFLCRSEDFATWMEKRKQPRMEHFYRWMRARTGVLMHDDKPEGGAWNYDVEGFVRQILGWREYVRGLYWHHMPQYLDDNALGAGQPLPAFYWDAQTDMNCLRITIGDTLKHAYAHHIQRLMVTGLFALLLGVKPRDVHGWYLAVYVDAVEWVELPNTLGMSQFADGGLMGSKPYIASGKYIDRMSNYCTGCRYDPALATGPNACPFTTLYWDFLERHQTRFAGHPRLQMQVNNLARKSAGERATIGREAALLRDRLAMTASAVPSRE